MATVNITCENDADFLRGFAFKYASGEPVNLVGQKMRMGIRKRAEDIIEDLLLTTENGGVIITDGAQGLFTIYISKDQLLLLPVGDYEHSLVRIVDEQGTTLRIWSGTLTNNAGPSR